MSPCSLALVIIIIIVLLIFSPIQIIFFFCCSHSYTVMCLNIGTPNNHHFPFGTNGKVVVLGVSILKHFRGILPYGSKKKLMTVLPSTKFQNTYHTDNSKQEGKQCRSR